MVKKDKIFNGVKKRKVCFIITSKIHYSRSKLILRELQKRDDVDLQIVVGGAAILGNYGDVLPLMHDDGFQYSAKVTMILEGGNNLAMAKTAGLGVSEFSSVFDNLEPDLVVVRADRYEILSAAIAAAYLNIPIAHIEGGDISGTIDESVRHAVTKLSQIHFPTNDVSKERIIRMGENLEYIHNFGAPDIEFVAKNSYEATPELLNYIGVGGAVDINKDYLMVMQHPVTSEVGVNRKNIEATLEAIAELGIPTIWFWPNVDAGTDEVSKGIRVFRENNKADNIRFIKYLPAEEFIGLLKKTKCLVGNSSAGIKECSYLGTPVVNIGTRQHGRMRAENVMDVSPDKKEIKKAISKQMKNGKYPQSDIYYQPDTAKNITDILAKSKLYTQKTFKD
ncbi:UDP-N-acetylglucosamine 2-epimerase [bacterium]|nr:UDP-N-acetylglucosamine 2-epimerase [bacterium]